jgi:hypothetical protein
MMNGLGYAQNAYNQGMATGPYSGQFVAGPNGYQTAAEQNANNYATGYGASLPTKSRPAWAACMGPLRPT